MRVRLEMSGDEESVIDPEAEPETGRAGLVQRLEASITIKEDVITAASIEGSRPATNLAGGHQGEHTTAFVTFRHMAINCVKGKTLEVARDNLILTLEQMKNFPGWADAPKYLTDSMDNTLAAAEAMDPPDKQNIQDLMRWTVEIRNSIPLTANSKQTSGGHNEAGQAGGLQLIEQRARTGIVTSKADVGGDLMFNVWGTYDFDALTPGSAENWAQLLVQHMLSIVASYPHIFEIEKIYSIADMKDHLYKKILRSDAFGQQIRAEIDNLLP